MSLVKREDLESDVYTGDHHVKTKAEIRVMLPHTTEYHRLSANHQKLRERHRTCFPHRCQRVCGLANTLVWGSGLQNCEDRFLQF